MEELIMVNTNKKLHFTTNKVVISNPHLLKPVVNSRYENSRAKYGTTIIISKDDIDTLNKINSAINGIIDSNNQLPLVNFKSPLKDGDKDYPSDKLYEHSMYMYVSSVLQPNVVDHKVKKILFRSSEFETGTYSKVSLEPAHYTIDDKLVVIFKLINVQILKGNKLLEMRSTAEEDFAVEED